MNDDLFTPDELGLDPDGIDPTTGYHHETGFNRAGVDPEGYNRSGFKAGADGVMRDRQGLDVRGYLPDGFHWKTGFNPAGVDRDGFNRQGFKLAADGVMRDRGGFDVDGYDADGFDSMGRDRGGYDRAGEDIFGGTR